MSDTNPAPGVSEATVAAEPPIESTDGSAEQSEADQQASEEQAQRDADDPRAAAERRAVERVKALREKQATPAAEPPPVQETEQQAADRIRDERGRFAPKEQAAADEPKYKVKVLGVEKEVPLSELLRGYGTTEAATQRFQEAARLRQEAEQFRQQQGAQPVQQTPQAPAEPEFFDPVVKVKTADGATYERPYSDVMAYGTPEEIRQATTQMRGFMAQPAAAPGVSLEQIQQVVRYTAAREREVQSLQQFLGENSAIVSDPDLATVAATKVTRLMMEDLANLVPEYGPQIAALPPQVIADRHAQARHMGLSVRPIGEIFAASAKETAERFGLRPTASGAQPFAAKAEAKRAAIQPVSGANARQAPTTDQPRRKTTSEIIQAERVARGLD